MLQKRSIFMLLFAIVLHCTGHSQGLWNKTYIEDRPLMYFSSVVYDNDVYHIAGGTRDFSGLNFTRAMLGQIDGFGNLVSYKTIYDSAFKRYGAFNNALILDNQQQLCYTGYSYDSVARIFFLKKNVETDSIQFYEYATSNATAFQGYSVLQYNDSSYYIAGVQTVNNNANVILLKIDSAGNRLWEKSFGQHKLDYASKIIKLGNGNLMLGAVRNTADLTPTQQANTWLLEVDTGGNFVRQWFDPSDSTYVAEGLLQTQDGGFVYGAKVKNFESGGLVATTATIKKMANDFSIQWVFRDGFRSLNTGIADIEELPDGSFVACGQKQIYGTDTSILSGWVIKLTADGQVIWSKIYTGINASSALNFLSDIDVLPDGSLIAVGQCQNSGHVPPQVGWFLKVDSNGCEIENCIVGIQEPVPKSPKGDLNSQLQVWPNPFNTVLSLALSEGEGKVQSAMVTITNLIGQVVYQQTETNLANGYTKVLDLSYLPNGVYFVAVSTGEATMVERVVKE